MIRITHLISNIKVLPDVLQENPYWLQGYDQIFAYAIPLKCKGRIYG